jgi:membrane protease YdiL (CAAX protease family)
MSALTKGSDSNSLFIQRHPVSTYFVLTFAISWLGAFLVASPHLLRHENLPQLTGVLMFPAMLFGPSVSGIALTWFAEGEPGLRSLRSRLFCWRIPARWYFSVLIPPVLILGVLHWLKTFVSAAYAPNQFLVGVLFGIPAGLLEEIGWSGYAFPKMSSGLSPSIASVLLGLLWGLWHLPVVNFLGAATPHGDDWLRFFLVFTAAMTAMRVLISWAYRNTNSVLLSQLIHISSTGSLVVLSPRVTARQEVFWYAIYAALLWLVAGFLLMRFGPGLQRQPRP